MSTPGTESTGHGALNNPDVGHEYDDVDIRGLFWFVVTLAGIVVVLQLGIWGLFVVFDKHEQSNDPTVSPLAEPVGTLPPQPRLQTTPWTDLQQFRLHEDEYVDSYGWVDQKAGVVHLPIDTAKSLLLQRGIPARSGNVSSIEGTDRAFAYGESTGGRNMPAGQADMSTASGAADAAAAAAAEPGRGAQAGAGAETKPAQAAEKKPGGGS